MEPATETIASLLYSFDCFFSIKEYFDVVKSKFCWHRQRRLPLKQ
ncbi:MAG: hypothetical protein AB1861_19665 [Cyanobacteriota bacterium]